MTQAKLVDTTRCIGCRACQVACKQWNELPAERTELEGRSTGLQNPLSLSAKTYTILTMHEVANEQAPGGVSQVFAHRQCMHCNEPACVSACPVTALEKTREGAVTYDPDKCLGCRYCVWACPFNVPTAEWNTLAPQIQKCDLCHSRTAGLDGAIDLPMTHATTKLKKQELPVRQPACVKVCPSNALQFGEREALLKEARQRIADHPGRYVNHIYGEKEAGGTSTFYLSAVPFEKLGFRMNLGEKSYPAFSSKALGMVAPAVIGMGGALAAVYLLKKRKEDVHHKEQSGEEHGVEKQANQE